MSIFTDTPITWTSDTKCDADALNKELKEKLANIDAQFPAGTLQPTARDSAITGWLLCQGQAISRATYAALFAAIGVKYGIGDGSTTFNIPTMKGRIPIGLDPADADFNDRGKSGGAKAHILSIAQMPSHLHGMRYDPSSGTYEYPYNSGTQTGFRRWLNTDSTGGGQAHNNLQPYVVINWLIKT